VSGPPTPARRGPSRTRLVVAAVLATLASLVAAVAVLALLGPGPVEVEVPGQVLPEEVAAGPCEQLAAELPETVDGLDRRETTRDDPRLAAWGRPAAQLVCGVPVPFEARLRPAVTIDGVSWDYRDAGAVVEWTSVDRDTVQVRLRVPTTYEGQGGILADLAGPLQASIGQVPLEENLPVG
jgi:hypothetical protein